MTLAIRAEGLAKTYTGEGAPVKVFGELSFEIEEGVLAAVMGPSGVGKSTLLHLLGGIDRPDAGRVEVLGTSLEELSPRERARFRNAHIGFVFQFHHLLPEFTAEENVAFPHRIAGVPEGEALRLARELLARVGLAERGGHGARALSGGEQQRVALARALARGPRVLLADEPTGNLDAASSQVVFDLLRELHRERGMTTIVVTHNPDLASRCDRLFTMSREGIAAATGLSERR
ncbi:MAG TPA: ABC transporter ATP-binding protein [Thermoanaerobaculia bacterium]|nr:ABC transporter ATP-binding protein [Thermoanaerobaculia bacterium]